MPTRTTRGSGSTQGLAFLIACAATVMAGPVETPRTWRFPERPPRIHIAKGLWWDLLRIHEAGALMGGAIYGESFDVYGHSGGYCGYGKTLGDFPHSSEKLCRYNAIVIVGCRAGALPAKSQKRLQEWVRNGGGLLITGGVQCFGQGAYHGTLLEELLPATVAETPDLTRTPSRTVLTPTDAGRRLFGGAVPWRQKPRLFYAHVGLQLTESAEVLVEAADQPMFVRHSYGRGRVALFAGTVCGEPGLGELPFWEWDGWPMVLSHILVWLVDTPAEAASAVGAATRDPEYAAKLEQLKDLADLDVDGLFGEDDDEKEGGEPKAEPGVLGKILKLVPACRDREYALAAVTALAESGTPFEPKTAERIFGPIGRHISGNEFVTPARELVASSSAGRVALGLRVLGRAKDAKSWPFVLKYAAGGLQALPKESGRSTLGPSVRVETGEDERLRLAAVRAAADYGDPHRLPSFREAARKWRRKESPPPAVLPLQDDLAEEIQIALCLMGDGAAAVRVLDTMVRNRLEIELNLDITQKPMYVRTPAAVSERKQAQAQVPLLRARIARLETTLARFPESGLPLLAKSAADWQGDFAAAYLQACLAERGQRAMDKGVRDALLQVVEKCRLKSVRSLCARRLRRSDPDCVSDAVVTLSRGHADDADFALSQLPVVPEQQRAAVIRAGLEHPDLHVRHRAIRSVVLAQESEREALLSRARDLARGDKVAAAILAQMGG